MQSAGRFVDWGEDGRARPLLVAALALAVIGAALRQPPLALLGVFVALVVGLTALWRRYGLRAVRYRRSFSRTRAFPGEEILIELTVENAKLLPLPWLQVEDEFPIDLGYPDVTLETSNKPKVGVFRTFFSVRPFERVRRRYRVIATERGFHRFGPAALKTGDVFGFATADQEFEAADYLIVYPRIVPVTAFGLPAKQPFGDEKPVRPLLEDPLRFSGVRPYAPGDLPRRIHWRATARTGELQAKQFEPGAVPVLALFLDVNTFEHFWEGLDTPRLERAISATASLAAHALEERRQVGLYSNAPLAGGERAIRIPPSRHPAQLGRMLEALALLIPHTGNRIETFIAAEARRLPWGATIVVVTGYLTSGLEATLANLHRGGHAITLISFGERPPDLVSRPGFTIYALGEEAGRGVDPSGDVDPTLAELRLA